MEVDLLSIAVVLASCALGVAVLLGIVEMNEAHSIKQDGWTRGHRGHHLLGARTGRH